MHEMSLAQKWGGQQATTENLSNVTS